MRKYLLTIFIGLSFTCIAPSFASADTANLSISDMKVVINILISIGVIPQDKVSVVNTLLASYETNATENISTIVVPASSQDIVLPVSYTGNTSTTTTTTTAAIISTATTTRISASDLAVPLVATQSSVVISSGSHYSANTVSTSTNNATSSNATSTVARRPITCGSKGDLNGDGYIDQTDYLLEGQVAVGTLTSTLDIADLNGDGRVSASDWVLINRYIAGADSTFPACPVAVNGVCGSSNGTMATSSPTTNLCSTGTSSAVSGSGPWTWSCTGTNGGVAASCSVNIVRRPLVCGSRGDLNSDGYIDQTDYNLEGQVAVGTLTSTLDIADINGDGRITISDWVKLGRYVSGLDTTFPNCSVPSAPNIVITNITADQYYVYVTYKNTGATADGSFIFNLSTTKGSIPGNYLYPFSVPSSGSSATTGGFTLGNLGLASGDTSIVTATLVWQGTPPAGASVTTFSKSVTVPAASINGACGTSNGTQVTSIPTTNLCLTGTASSISGSDSGPWAWSCTGSNGGTTSSCSATKTNSTLSASCSVSPSSAITNTSVYWTAIPNGGVGPYTYNWSGSVSGGSLSTSYMYGSAGIKSATVTITDSAGNTAISQPCSTTMLAASCGSSNGAQVSLAPSTDLCSVGIPSEVTGSGPWAWSCGDALGGTTASCSATTAIVGQLKCIDSDGGVNYDIKGDTQKGGDFGHDSCDASTSGLLHEYSCVDNSVTEQDYQCPNGCSDRACTQSMSIKSGVINMASVSISFDELVKLLRALR